MKILALLTPLVLICSPLCVDAQNGPATPGAEEIVARMATRDLQRQFLTEGYGGKRKYILDNGKLHKHAEMIVRVNGAADGTKHFEVVSEEGWQAAHKHVLRKMLDSEAATSSPEARVKTRLNTDNYDFQLLGTETLGDRSVYALHVTPRRKEKYLFRGRIWVDAEDYALVRAEGNPDENPSFWTKSTHFVQNYGKKGFAWFPVSTESVTEVRFFGTTTVSIEYFDYAPRSTFPDISFVPEPQLPLALEVPNVRR
jgi:hypothetical protein